MRDKPLIDKYFEQHHYEASDNCFTTLFMWQDPYGIRWAEENGVLYIQGGGKREPFLLPPFAGKDAKFLDGLLRAKEWFVENKLPFRFKGVSKDVKERMEDLCPGRYVFTPDRDNYEYIYKSEDLINLSGKKFRQKKNHLNQFRMQYSNYEYVPITDDIIPLCRETAASWVETHHEEGIEDELVAINLLFDNWEKANPDIRGLYQAINNEFIRHEFSEVEFINREEDMGLPGLRQAKESYNPDHFAEKYDAVYANEADNATGGK